LPDGLDWLCTADHHGTPLHGGGISLKEYARLATVLEDSHELKLNLTMVISVVDTGLESRSYVRSKFNRYDCILINKTTLLAGEHKLTQTRFHTPQYKPNRNRSWS
jgi:hypothetical protein